MGQGAQSKGLIQASITAGWDPRVIQPGGERIDGFDAPPVLFSNQAGTGSLPGGSPDGWADGYDLSGLKLGPNDAPRFNTPQTNRERMNWGTRDADPNPASPGVPESSHERRPK